MMLGRKNKVPANADQKMKRSYSWSLYHVHTWHQNWWQCLQILKHWKILSSIGLRNLGRWSWVDNSFPWTLSLRAFFVANSSRTIHFWPLKRYAHLLFSWKPITNLSINLPGTEYGPQTIKIPIFASSNQLGKGLESRLFQSGVYFASFIEVTKNMKKGKSSLIFMITNHQLQTDWL